MQPIQKDGFQTKKKGADRFGGICAPKGMPPNRPAAFFSRANLSDAAGAIPTGNQWIPGGRRHFFGFGGIPEAEALLKVDTALDAVIRELIVPASPGRA